MTKKLFVMLPLMALIFTGCANTSDNKQDGSKTEPESSDQSSGSQSQGGGETSSSDSQASGPYTIYFRDASWWNAYAASTNFVAWSGDTQPAGIGAMMTHLEYVEAQGFNYWSCEVAEDATKIMFIRTGNNATEDWGARTVAVNLAARGEHNMYDISASSQGWYGDGVSIEGVWATYSA